MTFPYNDPSTAVEIASLPFSTSGDFGGDNSKVTWFKYTATSTDVLIGARIASDTGGDNPVVDIYETIALTVLSPGNTQGDPVVPIQQPVTPGLTYYIRISPQSGTATITLSLFPNPTDPAAVGSLLISDDAAGFPATILDAATGVVLRAIPDFPFGESGDVLPSGVIIIDDSSALNVVPNLQVFAADLTPIATLASPVANSPTAITADATQFYVTKASGASAKTVYAISAAGVLGATWTLPGTPGIVAIGATQDGSTLYYCAISSGAAIKAYDLNGSAGLPDFAAGIASRTPIDLIVLKDDSVLVCYQNVAAHVAFVRHYSAAGATLADYTVDATLELIDRMGRRATDDPTSFWLWTQAPAAGDFVTSTFRNILTSDMTTVVTEFTVDNFEEGIGADGSSQNFGNSSSCPLIVMQSGVTPCVPATITSQPSGSTVQAGTSVVLTVTVSGTEPYAYQWYQGASGDTSTPIPGATDPSFTTPLLSVTTSYWVQVTNACASGPSAVDSDTATITVTPMTGQANTLIYDTVPKRWLLDRSQKTDIWTRLEEPGSGVYDQMIGGTDGVLYQYDLAAFIDDDEPMAWAVYTPWPDASAPRLEKQWGDVGVDIDPAGSVDGITATPVAQDSTVVLAPATIGQAASGRSNYIIDLLSGGGVIARNFGVQFAGTMESGDTDRPSLYWWEPSFLPKAPAIARRATDWDDLGYKGAKFVQGVVLRANTFGLAKQVVVQKDGGVAAIVLTVTHDGELQVAYPLASAGWTPFVTELVRLEGGDDVNWLLLDYRFVWEPAPELATQWTTQFTSAEWPGYGTVRDMVFAYESTQPMVLTYSADNVDQTYTLPSTAGLYSRYYFPFQPNKGKAIRFSWQTSEPGRIYKRDCSIRTQGWGQGGGYRVQSLFGGPSRADGAAI